MVKEVQYDLFGVPYCYDPDVLEDGYFVESESTNEDESHERIEWCDQNIRYRFLPTVLGFTFDDEEDALLFKLRWL